MTRRRLRWSWALFVLACDDGPTSELPGPDAGIADEGLPAPAECGDALSLSNGECAPLDLPDLRVDRGCAGLPTTDGGCVTLPLADCDGREWPEGTVMVGPDTLAVALADGAARIRLAPGVYPGPLQIGGEVGGDCADAVRIIGEVELAPGARLHDVTVEQPSRAASQADPLTAGVRVVAGEARVDRVRVVGTPDAALRVTGGTLDATAVRIDLSAGGGVFASGGVLRCTDCVVRGATIASFFARTARLELRRYAALASGCPELPAGDALASYGVVCAQGATVLAENGVVTDAYTAALAGLECEEYAVRGLFAADVWGDVGADCVRPASPRGVGVWSDGASLEDAFVGRALVAVAHTGGEGSVSGLRVEDVEVGLIVEDGTVSMRDADLSRVALGVGVNAGRLTAERVRITEGGGGLHVDGWAEIAAVELDVSQLGISALSSGVVEARGLVVRGAAAVSVAEAAQVSVFDGAVRDARVWAVGARGPEARVELTRVFLDGVAPTAAGAFGVGVFATDGALVRVVDSEVRGARQFGLGATDSGRIEAEGVVVVASAVGDGAVASGGGVLRMTDFESRGHPGAGVRVVNAKAVLVRGLLASNSVGLAEHGAADVSLEAVRFEDNAHADRGCLAAFCDDPPERAAPPPLPE